MAEPKSLKGWRVWYDPWDGRPLQSMNCGDNTWDEVPEDGIQGLLKFYEDGTKQVVSGFDWYFAVKHPSGPLVVSGNNDSPEDTLRRYPGAVLKRGKHTTEEWIHLTDTLMHGAPKPEGCKGCGD